LTTTTVFDITEKGVLNNRDPDFSSSSEQYFFYCIIDVNLISKAKRHYVRRHVHDPKIYIFIIRNEFIYELFFSQRKQK
jgi:hypothetical protein